MRRVTTAVKVRGPHRREWLFDRLTDVASFRQRLGGLAEVELVRQLDRGSVSRWGIEVHGCPLGWVQEERIDRSAMTFSFDGREGDFDYLSGLWRIEPEDEGSLLSFEARWDLGVPIVEDLLGNSVEVQLRQAVLRLMEGIRQDVESTPIVEARGSLREVVDLRAGVAFDGGRGLGRIEDISQSGARLCLGVPLLPVGAPFVLLPGTPELPKRIPSRVAWIDADGHTGVQFDTPLATLPPLRRAAGRR